MIVNIYNAERGKNKKSRGRRGLTLTTIMLHHHNNFRERVQKGKEMVRIGQEQGNIRCHHCSALAGNAYYKGDTKWRPTILMLISLYMEWETHPLS
jgi:hypothetical protein